MKTDAQIRQDVINELKWQPYLSASQIGVAVKNGIVTLSGEVESFYKKLKAEEAAKKVAGVKAIAEEIQLNVSPLSKNTDADIAAAALNALKWHPAVQEEKVKITVENGKVRLEGEVDWEYQRNSAASAIENLAGVKFIANFITVKPRITPADVQKKIRDAFSRSASIDADKITVEVSGSKVTLKGSVRSISEKQDAENAAWAAPGITNVDSALKVVLPEYSYED